MEENVIQEVLNAMEPGTDLPAEKVIEEAPSGDVKPTEIKTEEPVRVEEVKPTENRFSEKPVDKEAEIINNLQKALKEEREERKNLEKKFSENFEVVNKLKETFNPKAQEEPEVEEKRFLTEEEVQSLFERKEQERLEELRREDERTKILKEIDTLTSEWNGEDGKPKYEDSEVLEWQQTNNKLHLTPTEAFSQMKKNEIIDYEVKKRLSWAKPVPVTEKPSGFDVAKELPNDWPKTEKEIVDAVKEAMSSANAEL